MTKKEFLYLLEKYENGICSQEEEKALFKYCDQVQTKKLIDSWDLSEKELAKFRILQRINKTIERGENKRSNRTNFKVWKVAVICVGLLASSYFLIQSSQNHKDQIKLDQAITLELENGIIEIIEDDDYKEIYDRNGEIVGHQKGSQLVYYRTNNSKELTYNTLHVPYGKQFDLQLSDGTMVHLNAGSSLKYPVQFPETGDRQVFISGEAYLDVAKDIKKPFIVNLNELNVRVLGTEFNVNAYPEEEVSEVVLVEGSVQLYTRSSEQYKDNNNTLLQPGFKASFNKNEKIITKTRVPPEVYTAWINGELVYRNMPFNKILKKLERHYNVTIINNNKDLSKEKFNASFGKVSVQKVFENLKEYYGIDSKIKGRTITIH